MGKYLEKFLSTIPATQSKQIFRLLDGYRNSGAVKTVAEYNEKLQELSQQLATTNPQPMLKIFMADVGKVISASKFNAMVDAGSMDLETAFQEAEKIAEVLALHQSLFRRSILRDTRKAIQDMDDLISLYEFYNNDSRDFAEGTFNTFNKSDGDIASRYAPATAGLFFDPQLGEILGENQTLQVNLSGESLMLPLVSQDEVDAVGAEIIHDSETTYPSEDLQYPGTHINKIIDQRDLTYWVYPVLLDAVNASGIRAKVRINLGGLQTFDAIRVDPASPYPMLLESISYVGQNNQVNTVTLNTLIEKSTSIYLGQTEAEFLTFNFRQDNYEETLYYRRSKQDLFERIALDDLDSETPDVDALQRIADELTSEIPQGDLQGILQVLEDDNWDYKTGYQYTFGLDNIRLYNISYKTSGVFVGKPVTVQGGAGLIGFKANESNLDFTVGAASYSKFSFEYYVAKDDYDEGNVLLERTTLPIPLMTSQNLVDHERLLLTENINSSLLNTATMRFAPDLSATTPVVYRNLSVALTIGVDYQVKAGDDTVWRDDWPTVRSYLAINAASVSPPLEVKIKFSDPSPYASYTMDYTIAMRDSEVNSASWLKLTNDVQFYEGPLLRCSQEKNNTLVAKSVLYPIIIIRNNFINDTESAALLDYKLLASGFNTEKYMGD